MIRAAVLGASGYVGGELLRLIDAHPGLELGVAFAATNAGQPVAAVHPHLALAYADIEFTHFDAGALDGCQLILADRESERFAFDGLGDALALVQPDGPVDVRLFGKPKTLRNRRMGVALARAETVKEAVDRAKQAAACIKIRYSA